MGGARNTLPPSGAAHGLDTVWFWFHGDATTFDRRR